MLFKDTCLSIFSSGSHFKFSRAEPFVEILIEGIMSNITNSVKDQWFRCRLKYFLSTVLVALLFGRAEPLVQFWQRAL